MIQKVICILLLLVGIVINNITAQEPQSSISDNGLTKEIDLKKLRSWFDNVNKQHIKIQCALGQMYCIDKGKYRDLEQGLKLFEQLAEQGDKDIQVGLIDLYYNGEYGIQKNLEKARYWLEKLANKNVADASYTLGVMYYQGEGVEKDLNKARYWFEKATNGYSNIAHPNPIRYASYALGVMYYKGEGVPTNLEKACDYLEKYVDKRGGIGDEDEYALGVMYYKGDGVPQNLEKARYWFEKAQFYPPAVYALGLMYYKGEGVEKNLEKAQSYFKAIINTCERLHMAGGAIAEYALGVMYYKEESVEKDKSLSYRFFESASKKHLKEAEFMLSMLNYGDYENNDIPPMLELPDTLSFQAFINRPLKKIDIPSIFEFGEWRGSWILINKDIKDNFYLQLESVANQGLKEAQFTLGMMYYNGLNLLVEYFKNKDEKDSILGNKFYYDDTYCRNLQEWTEKVTARSIQKAKEWLKKAAEQEYVKAQCALGLIYYDEKDTKQAQEWFDKATKLGIDFLPKENEN